MLNSALALAKKGKPVFPCRENRRPFTEHGFKDASTDADKIRKWWEKNPAALIGMPTGAVSRTVVLDVDNKNGHDGDEALFQLQQKHEQLPDTPEVLTPNNGRHIYFRHPGIFIKCSASKIGDGLDIRADGGYVILPPSRVNGKCYEYEASNPLTLADMPGWLIELTKKGANPKQDNDTASVGNRNNTLTSMAGAMRRKGISKGGILAALKVMNEEFNPPLSIEEVDRVATSVGRYEPGNNGSEQAPLGIYQEIDNEQQEFNASTIPGDFLKEVAAMPPRPWIIKKHLLRGYVTVTTAPGGVGKSITSLVKAIGVTAGRDLLELGLHERCNVLYINNEDDEDELKRRIAGAMIHYGVEPSEIEGRFFWKSEYGNSLLVAQEINMGGVSTVIQGPRVEAMVDFCLQKTIGALIIDPFISTHNVPENDNTLMQLVVDQFKSVASRTRAALELVHHTKKLGGDSESHAGNMEASRGATALLFAARCHITVARMSRSTAEDINMAPEEAIRHIRMDDSGKQNFELADTACKWYRLESVAIGNGDFVGVPAPVDLSAKFEYAGRKDKRVTWTDCKVAEVIHEIMGEQSEIAWAFMREKFMNRADISESAANRAITRLPTDPVRIKVSGAYFEYWTKRAGKHPTAPIIVCRKEL